MGHKVTASLINVNVHLPLYALPLPLPLPLLLLLLLLVLFSPDAAFVTKIHCLACRLAY